MRTRDAVIALSGAAVLLVAVVGLIEIDARAGPYDLALAPATFAIGIEGTYAREAATGSTGPTGGCIPEFPRTECTGASTNVALTFRGLPPLAVGTAYRVFLVGAESFHIGALAPEGDAFHVEHGSSADTTDAETIIVSLHLEGPPTVPRDLVALEMPIDAAESDVVDIDTTVSAGLGWGAGEVRLNEIGGVTVSTVAIGWLDGPDVPPGWQLRAVFENEPMPQRHVDLGVFENTGPESVMTLDARVERVQLEDHRRFVVVLQPQDPGSAFASGFPLFVAELPH